MSSKASYSHRWGFLRGLDIGCVVLRLRMPYPGCGEHQSIGIQPGKNIKGQKEAGAAAAAGVACRVLPALLCHELFFFLDAPLPCHPTFEPTDYGLKLLQTASRNKPSLL